MSKARKKTKYAVIQNLNLDSHIKQANELLEQGYQPLGGISSVCSPRNQSEILYTQAFTFETIDENDKINRRADKATN